MRALLLSAALLPARPAAAAPLPAAVRGQVPAGFTVLSHAGGDLDGDGRADVVVALARTGERAARDRTGTAPPRPLLVFMGRRDGSFVLAGRNDHVVGRLDEGGQCDPFEDGSDGIVVVGRAFTVRNSVACGFHWTQSVTFRFDAKRHGFVFQEDSYQSWKPNDGTDPDGDALVPDMAHVTRADRRKPVSFERYDPR